MRRLGVCLTVLTAMATACVGGQPPRGGPGTPSPTPPRGGPGTPSPTPARLDLATLLRSARDAGITVRRVTPISEPFFAGRGHTLSLNGTGPIEVFEYASAEAAAAEAARVAADGYSTRGGPGEPAAQIEWIAPPHFFRRGSVMVVYLGSDTAVLAWLRGTLGRQFAGV